jgi:hypothetical protein
MKPRYVLMALLVAAVVGVGLGRRGGGPDRSPGSAAGDWWLLRTAAAVGGGEAPPPAGGRTLAGRLAGASEPYRDPTSPDYDPHFLLVTEGRLAREVFSDEPRDATWAAPMERQLRASLDIDLPVQAPSATVDELECRTAVCKIEISLPFGDWDQVGGTYPVFALGTLGGETSDFWMDDDGRAHAAFFVAFEPGDRDPEAWSRWWPAQRARAIAEARKRGKLTAEPRP